jgi:hypothetical protein
MGSVGPDLLFDLVQNATGKYAKEHAAPALDDPATMKAASRALLVADELRRRAPCARKATVPKAAAEGDARSLPFLRQMTATKPCGGITAFFRGPDCAAYPCFSPQERTSIAAAIAGIEKRDPSSASSSRAPEPKGPGSAAPRASSAPAPAPTPGSGAGLR